MNACSLNRREVLGRVDPVSSEVNGHGVSQDSGEWRRENICMLHKWDWWEYVSFVMRKWEKKDTAKLERENQRFTFFLFLQSHQFDRIYGGGGVMCFCLLSSHNTLCLLSLSLSLSLYDKKYVEKAFSDTQKLVPCWLTRGIGTKFIFNPSHTYNSIHYYIPIKKKKFTTIFLVRFHIITTKKIFGFFLFLSPNKLFHFWIFIFA